jgi:sugar phosphate isomerase/epimerase
MATEGPKLAVAASALGDDPRQSPKRSQRLGFSGIAFSAFSNTLSLPDLSTSGRREFRHLLSSQNQQLAGIFADLGPKGFAPGADVDRLLDRLDNVLETAKGLAAPVVSLDLGPLPPAPRTAPPKPKVTPEMAGAILLPTFTDAAPAPEATNLDHIPPPVDPVFTAQVDAALADLGRRADRYGVTVALRSDLADFASLERALRRADCPWFGVDLDPVAVLRDDWEADDVFSRLGPLVRHVRGRDATGGAGHRTRPAVVGQGDTDWRQFLARLDDAGYQGWITLDPLELPDRAVAAEAGKQWIEKAR